MLRLKNFLVEQLLVVLTWLEDCICWFLHIRPELLNRSIGRRRLTIQVVQPVVVLVHLDLLSSGCGLPAGLKLCEFDVLEESLRHLPAYRLIRLNQLIDIKLEGIWAVFPNLVDLILVRVLHLLLFLQARQECTGRTNCLHAFLSILRFEQELARRFTTSEPVSMGTWHRGPRPPPASRKPTLQGFLRLHWLAHDWVVLQSVYLTFNERLLDDCFMVSFVVDVIGRENLNEPLLRPALFDFWVAESIIVWFLRSGWLARS